MNFVFNDGGRAAAGFKGNAGDCVARSISIVTGIDYGHIYRELSARSGTERRTRGRSARNGIHTSRQWFQRYMQSLGFEWTPTMKIGSGCTVHLRADELPPGRLIVSLSRHYAAVIDGVLYDTHDCSRDGTRCVYGYWRFKRPWTIPAAPLST